MTYGAFNPPLPGVKSPLDCACGDMKKGKKPAKGPKKGTRK